MLNTWREEFLYTSGLWQDTNVQLLEHVLKPFRQLMLPQKLIIS